MKYLDRKYNFELTAYKHILLSMLYESVKEIYKSNKYYFLKHTQIRKGKQYTNYLMTKQKKIADYKKKYYIEKGHECASVISPKLKQKLLLGGFKVINLDNTETENSNLFKLSCLYLQDVLSIFLIDITPKSLNKYLKVNYNYFIEKTLTLLRNLDHCMTIQDVDLKYILIQDDNKKYLITVQGLEQENKVKCFIHKNNFTILKIYSKNIGDDIFLDKAITKINRAEYSELYKKYF